MTLSERERRIERAAAAISGQFEGGYRGHWCAEWQKDLHCERCMEIASAALDAADEAAPVVPEGIVKEAFRGGFERGVSSGTLAPRDFSGLEHHWRAWCHEAGFASCLSEEGTGI